MKWIFNLFYSISLVTLFTLEDLFREERIDCSKSETGVCIVFF